MKPLALASAALLLAACGKDSAGTEPVAAAVAESAAAPADPLEITPTQQLRATLKTGEPVMTEVGATITVAARIEVDETRITRISSPVMGRITALMAREGQHVSKGELLAQLNSTGLSDAQLGFMKALSQKMLAQRAVERAQQLLKAEVIGSAELQRREAEFTQASAELDGARDQLELLGMAPDAIEELQRTRSIRSVSRVVASMEGTVLARKVTVGQVVQAADTIFEIADLSHVWLIADVPESNAGRVVEGQVVEAEVSSLAKLKLRGRLTFVSQTLNPETRTVRVRMDVPNPGRRLKPAMLATMALRDQAEKRQVVPVSALVREGDTEMLFVERAPGVFVLRPVTLGDEFGNVRVLTSGIQPGEKIVTDGAFHLNNERRRRAVRGSGAGE